MKISTDGSGRLWAESAKIAWITASVALSMAACTQPAQDRPPNIVLITLDTTRADHLGAYGYERANTPHLDRFAQQAVVYETAYATSSWTLPSHASLFTGLLPMQHGAQTAPDGGSTDLGYTVRPLMERFETLAETLSAAGYRTAGVVAGPAMRRELGVAQGFDHYDDDLGTPGARFNGRRAELIANRAIEIARQFGEGPFFLFVNFFDPHSPYRPPPPYDRGLREFDEGPFVMAGIERLRAQSAGLEPSRPQPWERETADAMIDGYDAELSYLDIHLGRLLTELENNAPVLVAVTSDHGESFGEHGYTSHGAHLYEDNVRVPLIVRYPDGAGSGTRIGTPVQNHRLFATFLHAAGVPLPAGVAVRATDVPGGVVVTEVRRSDNNVSLFGEVFDRDLRSVYLPPYKLISSTDGTIQLFNLATDEAESRDLAKSEPEPVGRLSARLTEIARVHPALFDEEVRADLSPQTSEALRALGYLD